MDDPVVRDFSGHGFDRRLTKPYKIPELQDILEQLVKKTPVQESRGIPFRPPDVRYLPLLQESPAGQGLKNRRALQHLCPASIPEWRRSDLTRKPPEAFRFF